MTNQSSLLNDTRTGNKRENVLNWYQKNLATDWSTHAPETGTIFMAPVYGRPTFSWSPVMGITLPEKEH